jgi:hypothetical protein
MLDIGHLMFDPLPPAFRRIKAGLSESKRDFKYLRMVIAVIWDGTQGREEGNHSRFVGCPCFTFPVAGEHAKAWTPNNECAGFFTNPLRSIFLFLSLFTSLRLCVFALTIISPILHHSTTPSPSASQKACYQIAGHLV